MDEATFKRETIAGWLKNKTYDRVFCIETEETEPGFPDAIAFYDHSEAYAMYEFKASNHKGIIKFKPSQPRFYRKNPYLDITIVAYNNMTAEKAVFSAHELFSGGQYQINENLEVQL